MASYKNFQWSRSRTYCQYAFHGLKFLLQDVVSRSCVYFSLFSSETFIYGMVILLQQEIYIQHIYSPNVVALLFDILVEVGRVMCTQVRVKMRLRSLSLQFCSNNEKFYQSLILEQWPFLKFRRSPRLCL